MKLPRGLFALFCAEGLAAVLWMFLTPSESGRAVFLWFSRERLALFMLSLAIWGAVLTLSLVFWRSPAILESAQARLDRLCLEQKRLGNLLILLVIPVVLTLSVALRVAATPLDYASYRDWAPDSFPLLRSTVLAILPLLLLLGMMALEAAAYLIVRYQATVADRATWAGSRIGPLLLGLLIVVLTAGYWFVLAFQLHFFVNNPAWYWKFEPVAFHPGDVLFVLGVLGLLGLAYWLLVRRRITIIGLLFIFALGLFLQFGVGLMSGGGLASFRERYFSTYHKTYLSKATAGRVTVLESIQQYEQLYGSRSFTNTKPPGLMAFYIGLDHLVNGFPSTYTDEARYQRLSSVVMYAFPALAMIGVLAAYAFARRIAPGRLGLAAKLVPFLLVLCPNLVLFSLFPDQAIYPLLFVLVTWLVVTTMQRQSLGLAVLLGMLLYGAAFFAFTMLPLYPFAAIFLALHYWQHRRELDFRRLILLALAIAAGTLLAYLLFRFLLSYDFFVRFGKTVAINHNFDFYLRVGQKPPSAPESLPTRLIQILGAIWLNNLDFAAAVGFPIYVLFVVQGLQLLRRLWQGCTAPGDDVLGALLLSFVVLNLAGTAQGEVPRLWLFWLPMVATLAAVQLESLVKAHPRFLLGLGLLQLITLVLTFHFQDLKM